MKDLFQCKECGFLSTYYFAFIKVNGDLLCEYCARESDQKAIRILKVAKKKLLI